MTDISPLVLLTGFAAGMISFLSPCLLPSCRATYRT